MSSRFRGTLLRRDTECLNRLREAIADCREYDAILKDVADQQIEIDLDEVWNVIENDFPRLKETGEAMRDEVDSNSP